MKKLVYCVKIEQKNGAGFVKIPFDFFAMQIPSREGVLRSLTTSEVFILAYIMQGNGEVDLEAAAKKFNISTGTALRAFRALQGAGLVELLD